MRGVFVALAIVALASALLAGTAADVAFGQPTPPGPRFNPDWPSNGGPLCLDEPPRTVERVWQVSAPRGFPGPVRRREIVQLGLRDKFGPAGAALSVLARVVLPDGTSTTATTALFGDQWAYVRYPLDFAGAPPLADGAYTVVWEAAGGFIACDGFIVRNY